MRKVYQALKGIYLHNDLSCYIGDTLALCGSNIAMYNVLSCYTYNTHPHFGVLAEG